MTTTLIRPVASKRDSIARIRTIIHILEVQSRVGKIRWSEEDGRVYAGLLQRGVRGRYGEILNADPRDGFVLIATDEGDVVVAFNYLVDLKERGLLQFPSR